MSLRTRWNSFFQLCNLPLSFLQAFSRPCRYLSSLSLILNTLKRKKENEGFGVNKVPYDFFFPRLAQQLRAFTWEPISFFFEASPSPRAVMHWKQVRIHGRRPGFWSQHCPSLAGQHWARHPPSLNWGETIPPSKHCWQIKTQSIPKPVSGTQCVLNKAQALKKTLESSQRGTAETNLTRNYEVAGLNPWLQSVG